MNFDPLPDADNAAVGSQNDFFGDTVRHSVSFFRKHTTLATAAKTPKKPNEFSGTASTTF